MKHSSIIYTSLLLSALFSVSTSPIANATETNRSEAGNLFRLAQKFYDNLPTGYKDIKTGKKSVVAIRPYGRKGEIVYFVSGWANGSIWQHGKKVGKRTIMQIPLPLVRNMSLVLGFRNGKGFLNHQNDNQAYVWDEKGNQVKLSTNDGVKNNVGATRSSHGEVQAITRFGDISHMGIINLEKRKGGVPTIGAGDMEASCQNYFHFLFTRIKKREFIARSEHCVYHFNKNLSGKTSVQTKKGSLRECKNLVGYMGINGDLTTYAMYNGETIK